MKTNVAEFVRIQNQLNSHEFSYELETLFQISTNRSVFTYPPSQTTILRNNCRICRSSGAFGSGSGLPGQEAGMYKTVAENSFFYDLHFERPVERWRNRHHEPTTYSTSIAFES